VTFEHEKLIGDYLDGRAGEADVRKLESLVVEDARVRRELLLTAALETQLRQSLCKLEAGVVRSGPRGRRWRRVLAYAALVALAIGGWAAAAGLAHSARRDRQQLAELKSRVEALQAAAAAAAAEHPPETPQVDATSAPEIIDTRGLVLLLPEDKEPGVQVFSGRSVGEGQGLWTCPWGGADVRYADGTSIALDRSTTALFAQVEKTKRVTLKSGTLSLMRWPEKSGRDAFTIETPWASVAMTNGQVVVAVMKDRLLLEVAMGEVEVRPGADGRTIKVPYGHYAVVKPRGQIDVTAGRLRWQLEPAGETSKGTM
jgi:ferric-dicitrate binding protein FerR (iron transport regulator)